jgi:hypothetical protein
MPYPTARPTAKQDFLLSPDHHQHLVGSCDSFWGLLLAENNHHLANSSDLSKMSDVTSPRAQNLILYSYPDGPQSPGPIRRSLMVIGHLKRSSTVAQNLLSKGNPDPDTPTAKLLHRCTLGVKRYHPHMATTDKTNSTRFAFFVPKLRLRGLVAIVGQDKYGRFGVLAPMLDDTLKTSGKGKENFAADFFMGRVEPIRAWLAKMNTKKTVQHGNKRKRSFDETEQASATRTNDLLLHKNPQAAAAADFYSTLDRTLETRCESDLYHMRAFNGWVKATLIQELDPATKSRQWLGPLKVLDLARGKGGDLGKWTRHRRRIDTYVGVDVALGS